MNAFRIGLGLITATGLAGTVALMAASAANASVPGFGFSTDSPYTVSLDCGNLEALAASIPMYSQIEDVVVNYTNCAGYSINFYRVIDVDITSEFPGGFAIGGTEYPDVSDDADLDDSGSFTVHPNALIIVGGNSPLAGFYAPVIPTVSNPGGVLGATKTISIPATNPLVLTLPNEGSEFNLDNNDSCAIMGGAHVYSTLEVKVSLPGQYTFRYVSSDPASQDIAFWSDLEQMSDPYLAVYSNFDPANPNSGVVGCNDNGDIAYNEFTDPTDPYFEYRGGYNSESGQLMSSPFPQFTSNLEPGKYTLVLMSFGPLTADDWTTGNQGPFASDVELWGPEGGFTLAHTGTSPVSAIAYSGLSLTAGALLLAVVLRRRRAN